MIEYNVRDVSGMACRRVLRLALPDLTWGSELDALPDRREK